MVEKCGQVLSALMLSWGSLWDVCQLMFVMCLRFRLSANPNSVSNLFVLEGIIKLSAGFQTPMLTLRLVSLS